MFFSEIQFLTSSIQCTLHVHFHCGMNLQFKYIQFSSWARQLPWNCLGSCSNGWISGQGGQMGVVSVILQVKEFSCLEGSLL